MASRSPAQYILFTLAVTAVLLAAVLAWLLGSESAARLLLEGPMLQGVQGRLAGSLRAQSLRIDQPGGVLELQQLSLDWQPSALLQGEIHVERLRAGRLVYTARIAQNEPPPRLPASLALPLKLRVDALELAGGELRWGPLSALTLGGAALHGGFDGRQWTLALDRLQASGNAQGAQLAGQLKGQLRLQALPPFALEGALDTSAAASMAAVQANSQGSLRLSGRLDQVDGALAFRIGESTLAGTLRVAPFTDMPLTQADLRLRGFDLAQFMPGMPATNIDARLAGGDILHLALDNPAAAAWNRRGLPVRHLALDLHRDGRLENLQAALGSTAAPAGSLNGSGRLSDGAALALRTEGLNLRALDQRLPATRLDGSIALQKSNAATLTLELDDARARQSLHGRATLADDAIALEDIDLRLAGASLQAKGKLALAGAQAFAAEGSVKNFRLQELVRSARLPALQLNGDLSLNGARAPQLAGELDFAMRDSQLAGKPLTGSGKLRLRDDRLQVNRLELAAGENRLTAEGELGPEDGRIAFALRAPALASLGSGFGGSLDISGEASGALQRPRLQIDWNASRLQAPQQLRLERGTGRAVLQLDRALPLLLSAGSIEAALAGWSSPNVQLANAEARLQYGQAANAPLQLEVQLGRLAMSGIHAERVSLKADGSTAQHSIRLAIEENGPQRWIAAAEGGLNGARWQGSITQIEGSGGLPLQLAAPAALQAGIDGFALTQMLLQSGRARIAIEQLQRDADGLRTCGNVRELELSTLMRFASRDPLLENDLVLAGGWDLRQDGGRLLGTLGLRRSGGDVRMRGGANIALGLTNLEASASAGSDGLALRLDAAGEKLGSIVVKARAADASADARLEGEAAVNLPALDWLGPLLAAGLVTEGQLEGNVAIAGTLGDPRLAGQMAGRRLRVYFGDLGLDLRNGELAASFRDNALQLQQLRFTQGDGKLEADGRLAYAEGKPDVQLKARAARYPLLTRTDRRLVLSGEAALDWRGANEGQAARPRITGMLAADRALIDIGHEGTPELGDDVVIAGAKTRGGAPLAATIDLQLDLGKATVIRGRGLDAHLGGKLRLGGDSGSSWRAQGSVSVTEGSYSAYGRKLAIETGVLRFNGPLGNPALDITAMRRGQEVEAGVAVRGTVLAPRVTLVSSPTVPDAEKLSWLVLGHGLDNSAGADFSALQAAAGALLSEGAAAGVQTQISTMFGLDDFRIASNTQDNLQQRIVTVGKRLSARLYVSFQQALQTTGSVLLLRYTLSPRLTVEAEAGTRSAISLLYNITFD